MVPFIGYGGARWVRVLGRVILRKPGVPPAERLTNVRGWRSFTSVTVRNAEVTVDAGSRRSRIHADRGGVLDGRVTADLPPGWNSVSLTIDDGDTVDAPVFVVDDDVDFGIVSDVDDTIMVTALPRPLLAAWNTFVLDEHARTPVAGMAVLYERLVQAQPGTPVVYLSTGSWNVAPTLTRFLSRNLYPRGALLLTDWGPTNDRWFRSGPEHKRQSLERLADEFPGVRWLLIGDDGQADERIYGAFADSHADHLAAVAIRQLTPGQAVLAGGRSEVGPHRSGVQWVYAPDGAGLSQRLTEIGLL